jgi:sigma-E factor negative regulatory protein RseC
MNLPLSVGQYVEIQTGTGSIAAQIGTALAPPVLGFIAGFVLTPLVFPGASEAASAMAGVLMLFASALLTYQFRKHIPPHTGVWVKKKKTQEG